MQHSLVGKVVKIYHTGAVSVPYQPVRVAAVEELFINLERCEQSEVVYLFEAD